MNPKYLVTAMVSMVFITSCSTYRNMQTPDDVYYSPVIGTNTVAVETNNRDEYVNYISSDDRYLRMKVANRTRWENMDDFYYWNDPRFNMYSFNAFNNFNTVGWNNMGWNNSFFYSPGFSVGWNNFGNTWGWNNWGWNNFTPGFWNGACYNPIVVATLKPTGPRNTSGSNLNAFRNRNYNNNNNTYITPKGSSSNNSFGNLMRRAVGGSSTSNNNSSNTTTVDRPARTFSSGTNTNSSAGGNSGGYKSSGSSSSSGRAGRN